MRETRVIRWLFAALLAACAVLPPAVAQDKPVFVMGTTRPEGTPVGTWIRRIYTEAFRRLDMPLRFEVQPIKRLRTSIADGQLDGEALRLADFASDLPTVIRVEEPVIDAVFAVYAVDPKLRIHRLEDLRDGPLRGAYPRGLVECERALAPVLTPQRLAEVPLTEHGLRMLHSGRADFVCGMDSVVLSSALEPEFRGTPPLLKVIDVAPPQPLYLHVHQRHADLVPRIAKVLREMKGEGLIERYRAESLR